MIKQVTRIKATTNFFGVFDIAKQTNKETIIKAITNFFVFLDIRKQTKRKQAKLKTK